jgi:hypothetical protein
MRPEPFREETPPGSLGLQHISIGLHRQFGIRALLADDFKFFIGTVKVSSEAQQLKKKCAPTIIGRIGLYLLRDMFDSCRELAGTQEFLSIRHRTPRYTGNVSKMPSLAAGHGSKLRAPYV